MIVIVNAGAGNRAANTESPRGEIARLFAAAGSDARVVEPDASTDVSALAREAAKSSDDTIVAAGGDGTISSVAKEIADTGKTLGVLPIGTLNHFAKDLQIPLDLAA